jgi:hypothetical protein
VCVSKPALQLVVADADVVSAAALSGWMHVTRRFALYSSRGEMKSYRVYSTLSLLASWPERFGRQILLFWANETKIMPIFAVDNDHCGYCLLANQNPSTAAGRGSASNGARSPARQLAWRKDSQRHLWSCDKGCSFGIELRAMGDVCKTGLNLGVEGVLEEEQFDYILRSRSEIF